MSRVLTYSELIRLPTFEERFDYLRLDGSVGLDTFGYDRWMNQDFYRSREWKRARAYVISRDYGCDLGIRDRPIAGAIYVHHMNPLTKDDILGSADALLDPENLICVSRLTHEAITYGSADLLPKGPAVRRANDTIPWKR